MSEADSLGSETVASDQKTVPTPPVRAQYAAPDESEQTRWNRLLTRGIGEYSLKGILGRGTFGTVYQAHDEALDRDVAIKVLNNPLQAAGLELFQREARVIAALGKHPSIVQIHQWGECDGCPYFVLEYIQSSASDLLRAHSGGLHAELALRVVQAAALGLAHAHQQGILHRDIKPANILLENEGRTVKLADFGLAHFQNVQQGSDHSLMAGSPPYMSPEQIECRPLDGRADVFSLGVTLYQLLSGRLPFSGKSASDLFQNIRQNLYRPIAEVLPDLRPEICAIVEKATAHRPEDRFATAEEMAKAIAGVLAGQGEADSDTLHLPAPRHRSRKLALIAGAAVAFALALVVLVPGLFTGSSSNQVLAQARDELEKGDYEAAQHLYAAILDGLPKNPDALYGQGFAQLLRGAPQDASTSFSAIETAPHLRAEGLAAVAAEEAPEEARAAIEEAKGAARFAYPDVLLARLDLLQQKNDAVVSRLEKCTAADFYFTWQFAEALRLLGQANYGLRAYDKAQAAFSQLEKLDAKQQQQIAGTYLQLIQQQITANQSEAVRQSAQRISALLTEGRAAPATNTWSSRRLSLVVLPVASPPTSFALQSGLQDLLPELLGGYLAKNTEFQVVNRDELHVILAEQELSALLSSDTDRLSLGKVLGARMIVTPKFMRLDGQEHLLLNVTDTETTAIRPIAPLPISPGAANSATLMPALAESIQEMAAREYPLQARLYRKEQTAYIDAGADAGVTKDQVFDVYDDPELPAIPGAAITIASVGAGSAQVSVEGLAITELPSEAEKGLYVRIRRAGA